MDLAREITFLRRLRGWTQEELAEQSGLSVRTIRNIERGLVVNPRRSSMSLLNTALAVETGPVMTAPAAPGPWRGPQPAARPLVGGRAVLDRLAQAVRGDRLTTLVGAGGVGKTRLALDVAAQLRPSFGDGVAVVELGDLPSERRSATHDGAAILRRAEEQLRGGAEPADGGQRDMDALLVLDNAEHVPAGAIEAGRHLLRMYPNVHLLVTSRCRLTERLGVNVEIEPLAVAPAAGAALSLVSAVKLVLQRVGEDSRVAEELAADLPGLVELGRRLGGIPRYLEFAAERLRTIPLRLLLASGPDLDMLVTADRMLLSHQRSVAGSLRWDIDLLSDRHRLLLDRLAALPVGRFTLHDVIAVSERLDLTDMTTPIGMLSDLIEARLVEADTSELYEYRLARYVPAVVNMGPPS
ncbi:helix-turn-helix domain-containing protein [Dactylosporangium sp. NPDC048998]|uniref:helix-turn-helix domain-containing protein n=1 Tax=Dactylosporangium sp. NPDC048998 TaxID=3363976 RepID=UPI003721335F